jgi:hypothetical protein
LAHPAPASHANPISRVRQLSIRTLAGSNNQTSVASYAKNLSLASGSCQGMA